MIWGGHVQKGGTGTTAPTNNRGRVSHDRVYTWKNYLRLFMALGLLFASVTRIWAAVEGLPTAPDWVSVIQNVGFPMSIASVCLWVIIVSRKEDVKALYENTRVVAGLRDSIVEQTRALQSQTDTLRRIEVLLLTGRDLLGREQAR